MTPPTRLPIKTLARLLGGVVLGLLLIVVFDRLSHTPLPEPIQELTEVERSFASKDTLPMAQAHWESVSLPDDAPLREGDRQQAWYCLRFDLLV